MKISSLTLLTVSTASLIAALSAHAATITYDATYSKGVASNPDFTGYGSTGYLFDATAPVSSGAPSGANYTGVNPLGFSANQSSSTGTTTFATISSFSAGITATNKGGNYVIAGGLTYGTPQNGIFSYIGAGGVQGAAAADSFTINFSLASTTGYRIAILTQSNANNNGVNTVSLYTGGTSLATATSSATNPARLTGDIAFYSFDVTNIAAGTTVTVNQSNAQSVNLLDTYGFTIDALPAATVPEPSTFLAGGLGLLTLWLVRRRATPSRDCPAGAKA